MESFNTRSERTEHNPYWNRSEVRDLVYRHRDEFYAAGLYSAFADALENSVEILECHISEEQAGEAIRQAYSGAPIVVLTQLDEESSDLYISLAKINEDNGWLNAVRVESSIDMTTVPLALESSSGELSIYGPFTENHYTMIKNKLQDYEARNISFNKALARHFSEY